MDDIKISKYTNETQNDYSSVSVFKNEQISGFFIK